MSKIWPNTIHTLEQRLETCDTYKKNSILWSCHAVTLEWRTSSERNHQKRTAPAVHLVIAGPHGVEDVLGASPETDEGVHGALSMIKQCGETWAVASRDHSKSAQVARPVSSMNAVAGFPYLYKGARRSSRMRTKVRSASLPCRDRNWPACRPGRAVEASWRRSLGRGGRSGSRQQSRKVFVRWHSRQRVSRDIRHNHNCSSGAEKNEPELELFGVC